MQIFSPKRRWLWTNVLLFSLLLPGRVAAAPELELTQPPESTLVDRAHSAISDRISAPSRWFDNFFSDPRIDEEAAETRVRLRSSLAMIEGEDLQSDFNINARLKLPNLEKRFHLIISSVEDNIRDEPLDTERTDRELAEEQGHSTLALQYTQKRTSDLNLTHRLGVSLHHGLKPKARSRVRYSIPIADKSLLSLTQVAFWELHEGFGEESRIDYDVPLSSSMLIRTTGQGLFSETSDGYEWLAMLQWLTSFSRKKALAVGFLGSGETRPKNLLTEYNLFVKYRQKFLKKWLFIELKPELFWLRENDFEATSACTLSLEAQFND